MSNSSPAFSKEGLSGLYATIQEITSDVIWARDMRTGKGSWLSIPDQFAKYSLPFENVTLDDWKQAIHEEDREDVFNNFLNAIKDKSRTTFEQEYRLNGQDKIYFILDKMKIERDVNGEALRCMGAWKDLTELYEREWELKNALENQKRINQELQRTQAELKEKKNSLMLLNREMQQNLEGLSRAEFMFNKAQQITKTGSWQLDLKQEKFSCSNEFYAIHGIDRSFEFNYPNFFETLYGMEYGILVHNGLERVRTEGIPLDITFQYMTAMGFKRWFRLMAYPFHHKESMTQITGVVHDITSFKENEDSLRASEEKFFTLFKSTPDFMSLARESDGVIVDVNDKALIVSGYTESEMIGKTASELDLWVDRDQLKDFFIEYSKTGKATTEANWQKKNGEQLYIMLNSVRVKIGNENHRLSLVKDITSRKKAEEKFNAAFNLNPNLMIFARESDSVIVDVNEKITETFGYTREEVIGKDAIALNLWVNAEEREEHYKLYWQNKKVSYETKLRKKDGHEIYVLVSSVQIQVSNEFYILTSVKDTTARMQAEKKFQTVFHSSPDMMAIIRQRDGLIVEMNDSVFPSLGFHREDLVGKITEQLDIWFVPSDRIEADFSKGPVAPYEARLRSKSGKEVFVLVSTTLIEVSGEPHVLYITKDITDRKNAEEKLRYSEANLMAIINNTKMRIWSIDDKYNMLVSNEANKAFSLKYYGKTVGLGEPISQVDEQIGRELVEFRNALYKRVLAGEHITSFYEQSGHHFESSMNPIWDQGKVVGLTVFAMDVSDRIQREKDVVKNLEQLAEAEKRIGELKLMSLRSAMNPHFIFNALNSIQYFISNNERHQAIQYLSTFSKLIRGILVSSAQNKILLSDELELLKHYMDLEEVRFEEKFKVHFQIDPEIDMTMEVPSLLIQPFVENAIVHGLSNLEENGILKISIYPHNDDYIIFEIEDNGIGREAAKKLQRVSQKRHKSLGISLAEERLKMINKNSQLTIETKDLYSEDQKPAGTLVRIWLQLH